MMPNRLCWDRIHGKVPGKVLKVPLDFQLPQPSPLPPFLLCLSFLAFPLTILLFSASSPSTISMQTSQKIDQTICSATPTSPPTTKGNVIGKKEEERGMLRIACSSGSCKYSPKFGVSQLRSVATISSCSEQ